MDQHTESAAPQPEVHKNLIEKLKQHAAEDAQDDVTRLKPDSAITERYTASVVHAAVRQAFKEMVADENMAALTQIIMQQSANVVRQSLTDLGRKGARIAAQEAFTGSYDAMERKTKEWWEHLPQTTMFMMIGAGVYMVLLALGLLMLIWKHAMA
jgi:Glu-tRNA(Gln) amidotransferase subunit E-like FAD-binding protein